MVSSEAANFNRYVNDANFCDLEEFHEINIKLELTDLVEFSDVTLIVMLGVRKS